MGKQALESFIDAGHLRAFKQGREAAWLRRRGFDGLYADCEAGCACEVSDLYPCGERQNCKPGVKGPCDPDSCTADGRCDWHIGPKSDHAEGER